MMKDKKARLSINAIIIMILVVLVIAVVGLFVFNDNIWNWMKNLPGYNYDDSDKLIDSSSLGKDVAVVGSCPDETRIGKVAGGRVYLMLENNEGEERDFDLFKFKGSNNQAFQIEIDGVGVVAELKQGENLIKVKPEYLDQGSDAYEKIRFKVYESKTSIKALENVNKLDNSYLLDKANLLCRVSTIEESETKLAWPATTTYGLELVHLKTEDLKLEKKEGKILWKKFINHKIDFYPYVKMGGKGKFRYLYLVNWNDHIEIRGEVDNGIDWVKMGRIYPDGSVWLDEDRFSDSKTILFLGKDFQIRSNFAHKPYGESNLRVDYEAVRKFVDN